MAVQHGITTHTHENAVAGSTVEVDCLGFNSLIVWHEMTGVTTGGHVTVECRHAQGETGITHPAAAGSSEFGLNVKDADVRR